MHPIEPLNDILSQIAGQGIRISFLPGEVVWVEAEDFQYFYILEEGSVELSYLDDEGERLIIDIYHAGDFFGAVQMAGLTTKNRTVTALTHCSLYRFTPEQFSDFWDSCPGFSRAVFQVICQRLIRSGDEKACNERLFLRQRVMRVVRENLNESGYFRYGKDVLRGMVGSSTRSLNRTLLDLAESGEILYESGTIKPVDR